MKKMIAMILAAGAMSGFAAPTANEDFVVAEDAKTYTNAVQAAKEYTDAAVATAARPATRIVTEDGMRFTDATGCVFAVSFTPGRFVATNLFLMAPGVEFVYTNINPIAWGLVGGSPAFRQMAKFVAYDATMKRWIALNVSYESLLTPENIAGFDASFQSATNTPIDAASFTLYDRGYVGDADHAEGTFYNVAGAPVTSLVDRVMFESSVPQSGGISTNDVCAIVTNEVSEFTRWECNPPVYGMYQTEIVRIDGYWYISYVEGEVCSVANDNVDPDATNLTWSSGWDGAVDVPPVVFTATRAPTGRTINALGLARASDIPSTNGFVTAAITNNFLPKTGGTIYNPNTQSGSLRIWDGVSSEITFDVGSSATLTMKTGSPDGLSVVFGGGGGGGNVTVSLLNDDENATLNVGSYRQDDMFGGTVNIGRANTPSTLTVGGTNVMEAISSLSSSVSLSSQASTNYTDSAISSADTTYKSFALAVPTNVNQSIQFLNIEDPTPSTIDIPLPAGGGTKDWIIYIYAATNVTLRLPSATWWLADTSATNDIAPRTPTALYFSQAADGIYTLGRQEFTEVVLP